MRKINIGLFIDTYFPMIDGVIMVVDNYAKRLSKYANVYVFAPRIPKTKYNDSIFNYKVIRCKSIDISFIDYALPLPDFDKKFKEKLNNCNLDIIHIHSPATIGNLAVKYAKKRNIPVIATFHSQYRKDFYRATKSKFISNLLIRMVIKLYNNCNECWTMNNEVARIFQEEYGYKKNIKIINNATDMKPINNRKEARKNVCKKHGIDNNHKILLFVARINKLKNIELIVESLRLIDNINYKMLFIGNGQDDTFLNNLITKYGLNDKIIMCGRVTDREELAKYYASADLFLFPSLYDSNSLVQLEAASQKTPTLFVEGSATSAKVIPEVDGFFAKNSPKDYSKKIIEIIQDKEKLKKVSEKAYEDLYISWDDEVERVYKEYIRIIESREK